MLSQGGVRMNSEQTNLVKMELFGQEMRLAQDPNSQHLGKTVWDASMVLSKYLEKNENKGEFSRKKLAGKRALELGAGCGLAGIGLCLLGCHVVTTDQREVLPILQQNIDWNVSKSVLSAADHSLRGPVGDVHVAELDWGNEEHIKAVSPPFDLVVAADVLYAEHLVEPLLRTIADVTGPRTTTLISYELRSQSVHAAFLEQSSRLFSVRKIPHSKMHPLFQHPSIDIYALRKLPQGHPRLSTPSTPKSLDLVTTDAIDDQTEEELGDSGLPASPSVSGAADPEGSTNTPRNPVREPSNSNKGQAIANHGEGCSLNRSEESKTVNTFDSQVVKVVAASSVWATRRAGVEAARSLAGIKVCSPAQV